MTSGSDGQDPFLSRPSAPIRSGRPIDAPPPAGPRFNGPPPPSGTRQASSPAIPDPSAYSRNAPPGTFAAPFSRTWKVTFRRWGKAWLTFLALGVAFGLLLGALYPSPGPIEDMYSSSYYLGTFWGAGISYLLFFGWWLDHVLAQTSFKTSLIVQALLAGAIGLVGGSGAEANGDPIGFPLGYLFIFGALAIALAHVMGKKIEGSFEPSDEDSYSPSGM